MTVRIVALWCAVFLTACGGASVGEGFGLDGRVAPSGLTVPVSPPGSGSLGVTPVNAFANVRVEGATYVTGAGDGTNRLFVTARTGVVWTFANASNASASVLLDLSSRVYANAGEAGILGLAFDPRFSSNRFFYVSYTTLDGGGLKVRLSRFTASGNTASAATERVLFEYDHGNDYHFGGWLGFGPDGLLYMTTGDGGNPRDAQAPESIFGKVLRMRIDAAAGAYSVPDDNPFGNLVWASGFRNPWRCSFDRAGNGHLYCGDVGEATYEEVNLVQPGKNYGWPFFEGPRAFVDAGDHAYEGFEPALLYYPHSVGVAVIGGYVYRGKALPALTGRFVYSDFGTPNLWSMQPDGSGNTVSTTALPDIRSFGEDDAGELYALSGESGVVYRFQAGGGSGGDMPSTLSATGLFTDTAALTPSPFMIDYSVNWPHWSDGANQRRWFVLPGNETVSFSASDVWQFPVGTITVKQFDLGSTRVETRVMVQRSDGWAGFSYRWRADQRDADLVGEEGTTATVGAQSWSFPSRAQCMNCHTQVTGRALGLNTRQLNGLHTYAASGRSDNQLRALNGIGVFARDIGNPSQYHRMPAVADAAAAPQARAKAYLDSNCAMCHQPGGPTPANMDLRFATGLEQMNIRNAATTQSAGGVRLAPGNHAASDLWKRTGATDASRMPTLGVQVVDDEALQLLATWIDGLR